MKALALFLALVCVAGSARAEGNARVVLHQLNLETGKVQVYGVTRFEDTCTHIALDLSEIEPKIVRKPVAFYCSAHFEAAFVDAPLVGNQILANGSTVLGAMFFENDCEKVAIGLRIMTRARGKELPFSCEPVGEQTNS